MYLSNNNEIIYSNIQDDNSISFEIGDASIIIDIIRNKIYSHPIRTLVQEYLSNAKDACWENKTTEIIVTLPTAFNPELSIRDYGVGLSVERLNDIFVKYGFSTKRDSKKQLGCFGIGSKSAWAYTDSFVIESFYNGVHSQYIAETAQQKEGRLVLIKNEETTEPNGVLIKIPTKVQDIAYFQNAVIRATFLWKHKPKLINLNIAYPEHLLKINSDIDIYKSSNKYISSYLKEGCYLNANGIPFYIDDDVLNKWAQKNKCILTVKADPLKLNIAANREGFVNIEYAKNRLKYTHTEIYKYLKHVFESASYSDYLTLYSKFHWLIKCTQDLEKHLFKNYTLALATGDWCTLSMTEGYFLFLQKNTTFISKMKSNVVGNKDNIKIYRSRSKGIITNRNPDISVETKKAITIGRKIADINSHIDHYILFQNQLPDDAYNEILQILKIDTYIEDISAPKENKKTKVNENNNDIKICNFQKYRAKRFCAKMQEYKLSQLLDKQPSLIFYGTECTNSMLNFLNTILDNDAGVFYIYVATRDTKKFEAILKNTNITFKNFNQFDSYILDNPKFINKIVINHIINEHRSLWTQIINSNIQSRQFNMSCVKKEINQYIGKDRFDYSYGFNTIRTKYPIYAKDYILYKFITTYPLLNAIPNYTFNQYIDDINLYISAVDDRALKK